MSRCMHVLRTIAFAVSILTTTEALAAGQRTFVASNGLDTNPCTLLQPCRSFAPAITQTNAGGEVVVLDSAGYGSFTITKAISIIAPPGVYAGLSPTAGQDGVTVNAGVSDKVVLRGLTINGQGGDRGIVVNSGSEVHIEQCTVANMASGIHIYGGGHIHIRSSIVRGVGGTGLFVGAGTPVLDVSDSQFVRNGNSGISMLAGSLAATRVILNDNGNGFFVVSGTPGIPGANVAATIVDSVMIGNLVNGAFVAGESDGGIARLSVVRTTAARNGSNGFGTHNLGPGVVLLLVSDSVSVENGYGLGVAGAGATAIVTRSTLADNVYFDVEQAFSAVIRTSGNNTLTATGSSVSGSHVTNTPF